MGIRQTVSCERKGENGKKAGFAAKTVLLATLASAPACVDVNVNPIPYDPTAPDAGTACFTDCSEASGILREEGNSAGSSTMNLGRATLGFKGLVDEGSAKAASLELSGCGEDTVSDALKPGETTTFTINGSESVSVSVETIDYDGAGLRVRVRAVPVCEMDAGVDAAVEPDGAGGSG